VLHPKHKSCRQIDGTFHGIWFLLSENCSSLPPTSLFVGKVELGTPLTIFLSLPLLQTVYESQNDDKTIHTALALHLARLINKQRPLMFCQQNSRKLTKK